MRIFSAVILGLAAIITSNKCVHAASQPGGAVEPLVEPSLADAKINAPEQKAAANDGKADFENTDFDALLNGILGKDGKYDSEKIKDILKQINLGGSDLDLGFSDDRDL